MLSIGIVGASMFTALSTPLKPANALSVRSHKVGVMDYQAYARAKYKVDEIQVSCLITLWTMESHWNPRARGGRTTQGRAHGIAQALPAKKMAVIADDYMTNAKTQIKWGLLYIKNRYANKACYALKHEFDKGWY